MTTTKTGTDCEKWDFFQNQSNGERRKYNCVFSKNIDLFQAHLLDDEMK